MSQTIETLPTPAQEHRASCEHGIPPPEQRRATVVKLEDTLKIRSTAKNDITWMNTIKNYFTERDRNCMLANNRFDLFKYEDVRDHWADIHGAVEGKWMPRPPMPTPEPPITDPSHPDNPNNPAYWSEEWVNNFYQWGIDGWPFGTQVANLAPFPPYPHARKRKNLTELEDAEIELLRKAFAGIMALPTENPNSFFHIASFHGLPGDIYCWHHFHGFLPWHRYYNLLMENALRTVKGCENVTLPYWDISDEAKPIPQWVWEAPFGSYVYQSQVGEKGPDAPDPRNRATRREVHEKVTHSDCISRTKGLVAPAMEATTWEHFAHYKRFEARVAIEEAHDYGHNLAGGGASEDYDAEPGNGQVDGDMLYQEYTAFDPIFWFQHCEFDRLCWEWQKLNGATTVQGHMKTWELNRPELYIKAPLDPWREITFEHILDLSTLTLPFMEGVGIDYAEGTFSAERQRQLLLLLLAKQPFPSLPITSVTPIPWSLEVKPHQKVVRLKKLDRTKIHGSFKLLVFANYGNTKKLIATEYVFQAKNPAKCARCAENPITNYAFSVKENFPEDTSFSVEIRTSSDNRPVDISLCGHPKLKIGLTLEQHLRR